MILAMLETAQVVSLLSSGAIGSSPAVAVWTAFSFLKMATFWLTAGAFALLLIREVGDEDSDDNSGSAADAQRGAEDEEVDEVEVAGEADVGGGVVLRDGGGDDADVPTSALADPTVDAGETFVLGEATPPAVLSLTGRIHASYPDDADDGNGNDGEPDASATNPALLRGLESNGSGSCSDASGDGTQRLLNDPRERMAPVCLVQPQTDAMFTRSEVRLLRVHVRARARVSLCPMIGRGIGRGGRFPVFLNYFFFFFFFDTVCCLAGSDGRMACSMLRLVSLDSTPPRWSISG